MKLLMLTLSLMVVTTACEIGEIPIDPIEKPIEPEEKAAIQTNDVALGSEYLYQTYFDFGTNSFVKTNIRYDWDLAFHCEKDINEVALNSSILMQGVLLETTDFEAEIDVKELEFRAHYPAAPKDSLPLNQLVNSSRLVIIDLGIQKNGANRGYKKMMVDFDPDRNSYLLKYANLDGTKERSILVEKDQNKNWIEVNLSLGEIVDISPDKKTYDLYIGQYTYQFYEPYTPYLVVGALNNPYQTTVALVENQTFEEVSEEDIPELAFSDQPDKIGYEWKFYDFDEAQFLVNTEMTYVIRDTEGEYYKMRFLDFYDNTGVKGHPRFQFQQL